MKILKTTDYKLFKELLGNRLVNNQAVRNLRNSVEKTNLLHLYPIIVNDKMEIIDGQHRLLVAKKLGIAVYYTILPGAGLEEVQLLNANSRRWFMEDYLHSYVTMKKPDYIILQDFIKQHDLGVMLGVMILSQNFASHKELAQSFKLGKFVVVDKEKADDYVRFLLNICAFSTIKNLHKFRDINRALIFLFMNPNFEQERLSKKFAMSNIKIPLLNSKKEYLQFFENVYNFQSPKSIRLY